MIMEGQDYAPSVEVLLVWKAVAIMPALLLQKPSQNSKAKEHVEALNRRLTVWYKGGFSGATR